MKVIQPITIDATRLISSSVPETDYAAYAAGTNYAVGARVIYQHVIYESVQTPNTGHTPGTDALYWANIAPTNRWLMFDQEVSTATTAAAQIVVTVAPGLADSIALLEISGALLNITVRDGAAGPIVYSHDHALDGSAVFDWQQYFYEPFIPIHDVTLTDLPLYGSAQITVTLTGAGTVEIGSLIAGITFELGDTQYGASAGIIDYSRKDTNAAGVTTFVRRKFSKRMSAQLMVNNYALNNLHRILSDLRATPCVWIGTDAAGFEPLTVFGFYRDFSIDISYPTISLCNLEIEGLT
jgi:hypothetical protein